MKDNMATIYNAVLAYAKANWYTDGWDYFVETVEPREFAAIALNNELTTAKKAKAYFHHWCKQRAERREEMRGWASL